MSGASIKQPFQSGYLMDIPRGIERLEIAHVLNRSRGNPASRLSLNLPEFH
jgi:hypothetical protein